MSGRRHRRSNAREAVRCRTWLGGRWRTQPEVSRSRIAAVGQQLPPSGRSVEDERLNVLQSSTRRCSASVTAPSFPHRRHAHPSPRRRRVKQLIGRSGSVSREHAVTLSQSPLEAGINWNLIVWHHHYFLLLAPPGSRNLNHDGGSVTLL